jgi:hypothetical protein
MVWMFGASLKFRDTFTEILIGTPDPCPTRLFGFAVPAASDMLGDSDNSIASTPRVSIDMN